MTGLILLVVGLVGSVAYFLFSYFVGYEFLAPIIHFGRVALALGVLVLYVPVAGKIFREVPAPHRDYLIAGIILTWASAFGFSVWNEAGNLFGFDRSIFTSPIAGFFSLTLVVGGLFHVIAPSVSNVRRFAAAILGGIAGILIAVVAPFFL